MEKLLQSLNSLKYSIPQKYESSMGSLLWLYEGVSKEQSECAVNELKSTGYTAVQEFSVEDNAFCTLKGKENVLQVNYFGSLSCLRVVFEPSLNLPQLEPKSDSICDTEEKFWQFEVDHSLIDCGMCYIIRLSDGSFFIVDSGHTYSFKDGKRIRDFLIDNTPKGKKTVIAGWFFSHGHVDHIGQFMNFLENYSDGIPIEGLYFNFIPPTHRDNGNWSAGDIRQMKRFYNCLSEYTDISVYHIHSGQRFYIRDLLITALCSHEDVFPNSNANFNDSSVVLMLNAAGTKIMLPGDAGDEESKILEACYPNYIKAPIVQVAHHGHFGTSVGFYEKVNAEVALFATTQIKFDEEFVRLAPNRKATELAKYTYIASNGTVEIALPYKSGNIKTLPDEIFESFSSIYHLWAYTYTDERKKELYDAYLSRGGRPLSGIK